MTADLNSTLTSVGTVLGALFNAIAVPLGTLLIVVIIAGAVGAILYGIATKIGKGME
jgi:hypothetical protein